MNAETLEAAWDQLPVPDTRDLLQARRVAHDIWAAIDHDGHPHLLLGVPDDAQTPPVLTRGLRVTVARHMVAGHEPANYLDLGCLDDGAATTFAAVAADIGTAAEATDLSHRVAVTADALARWRWFWDVDPARLSSTDALGLFAELWFLTRWAGPTPETLDAWTGSDAARHDFQWTHTSVEVKATTRRDTTIHHIQHLDQLTDPPTGQLYLFSMTVVRDRLARNSLTSLIDQITDRLAAHPHHRERLWRELGRRGYTPAHRGRDTPYRVVEEKIYKVTHGFPRLVQDSFPEGMPAGITDVSYLLDMAACEPWSVTTSPDDWHADPTYRI